MTPLTAAETAELYWQCLEAQRNVGLHWDVFKCIPYELQRIAPLKRCIAWRYPERGVRLKTAHRVYSTERAESMLDVLQYDLYSELNAGYDSAKQNFIAAVLRYQRYILTLNYYG